MRGNIVAAWQFHIPSYTTGGQYESNDLLHPRRSALSECFWVFFCFFMCFLGGLGGGERGVGHVNDMVMTSTSFHRP